MAKKSPFFEPNAMIACDCTCREQRTGPAETGAFAGVLNEYR